MTKNFGTTRYNVRRKIVRMRTKDEMSWAAIAEELEMAPRTARRLFQEHVGEGQHHDHLEGKGGRFPAGTVNKDGKVTTWKVAKGVAPYVTGGKPSGAWQKQEVVAA